jgi:hypothetical protein
MVEASSLDIVLEQQEDRSALLAFDPVETCGILCPNSCSKTRGQVKIMVIPPRNGEDWSITRVVVLLNELPEEWVMTREPWPPPVN